VAEIREASSCAAGRPVFIYSHHHHHRHDYLFVKSLMLIDLVLVILSLFLAVHGTWSDGGPGLLLGMRSLAAACPLLRTASGASVLVRWYAATPALLPVILGGGGACALVAHCRGHATWAGGDCVPSSFEHECWCLGHRAARHGGHGRFHGGTAAHPAPPGVEDEEGYQPVLTKAQKQQVAAPEEGNFVAPGAV
jgi:hypothetical protein